MVESTRKKIGYNIKYLGLLLRDDWSLRDHLEKIAIKAEITVNKLNKLMANKKGPSESKRKLYQNVANSVLLYGAPVWAEEVNEFPNMVRKIRAVQRKISLRVIRAYRTVSLEVALVLTGNPPIELQEAKLRAVYVRKREAAGNGIRITENGLNIILKQEQDKLVTRWREKIRIRADTGRGFNLEILSYIKDWVGGKHGELTYQATQLVQDTDASGDTPIE